MKKIFVASVLLSLALPVLVGAQAGPPQNCTLVRDFTAVAPTGCNCAQGQVVNVEQCGICCAFNSFQRVIDVIFAALIFIAIILFLIGAYTLLTAGGDPARVGSGRNYLLFAIVGLAVAFLARSAPALARFLVGA